MLLDKLKNEKKSVFLLGINNISIAISNYLINNQIKVFICDIDEKIIEKYRTNFYDNQSIEIVKIDKYDFNNIDYLILCKNLLLDNDDLQLFITRLNNIKDKVFLCSNFISMLFPNNKFISIIGTSYNYITTSILSCIFKDNNTNVVNLSSYSLNILNNDKINIEQENCIYFSTIENYEIEFLKQINFDILAILNINYDLTNNKYEDYIKYIQNDIILKQKKDSTLILNVDNEFLKEAYENIKDDNININCKILPMSTKKMLNNGFSYINGTIYNYFNNNNESYDFGDNEYLLGNINKSSVLCSSIILQDLGITSDLAIELTKNYKGLNNYMEYLDQFENIKFISNVAADSDELLLTPFEIYNNIYPIFIVNDKQTDLTFLKNNIKNIDNIFIVDICGLFNIDEIDKLNIYKYNNLKDIFDLIIEKIDCEYKEKDITILLSPIIADKMNIIYYSEYTEQLKELIKGLKNEK